MARAILGYRMKDCGGRTVVVQDVDNLRMEALVGEEDENGIVWDRVWVSWEDLTPTETKT